jgi:tetratricopeptide (TPR) repeat protein
MTYNRYSPNVSKPPKFLTNVANFFSAGEGRNLAAATALHLDYNGEPMTQHARKPAIAALLLTLASGAAGLSALGALRAPAARSTDLATLERQIAGRPDAETWDAYGDALRAAGRFAPAAEAYQRALALDPSRRTTKINIALALAQAHNADGFFTYVSRLTMTDAKLASDLLERPELVPLHADARFTMAANTAHAQAVD